MTILALLGTLIGVAALVVGQAITQGIQKNAREVLVTRQPHIWVQRDISDLKVPETESLGDLGLSDADLAALGISGDFSRGAPEQPWITFDEGAIRTLNSIDGLSSIQPVLAVEVFLNLDGQFSLHDLRGVGLAEIQASGVALSAVPNATDWGVIVPNQLVWSGQVQIGQTLPLITAQLEATPVGRLPIVQDFQVVATYPASIDAPLLTTLATNQLLLNAPDKVSALEIFLADPFDLTAPRQSLSQLGDGIRVETWRDRRGSVTAFLSVLRLVMLVVLGLILLVAAFNIFAGQLLLTDTHRRAIAFMRSAGFSRGSILRIFLLAGVFIGGGGTLIGLALGVGLALNFPLLTQLGVPGLSLFAVSPPIVLLGDLMFTLFIALGFTFLAAILPAWSAASTSPAEAFKNV